MTNAENIALVKAMIGDDTTDKTISAYLTLAGQKICRYAFPFDDTVSEVPEQYSAVHVEAAVYMLNKRGAEGQTDHNENGIARTYETGDLPKSLLNNITPMVGMPR